MQQRVSWAGVLRVATLFGGLLSLFVIGSVVHPQFLTIANQRDVLANVAVNGILAVGMTLVILSGGIDLSVGSVLSLCTVVCAMLLMHSNDSDLHLGRAHHLAWPAVALFTGLAAFGLLRALRLAPGIRALLALACAALAAVLFLLPPGRGLLGGAYGTLGILIVVPLVGALLGFLNGAVIARTGLQPFIVTLAMMIAAVGLAKFIAGQGGRVHTIQVAVNGGPGAPGSFEQLGATILTVGRETLRSGRELELKLLPVQGLFMLGVWAAAAFLLHKLPLGRYVYATGGNEEAARLAGVPVGGVKIFVYAASGLLAGLAAVLYCAQYAQGKADAGQMKELDAIAAVVIGGTTLQGGRGSIVGTLVGVMIFGYLTNILQLRAVSSEIQDILKGVIIVVAAVMQSGSGPNLWRYLRPRRPS